jgi:Protein kinase domain
MWQNARNPRYLEPYQGNLSRVLEIAGALARTLAFMHETSPGWVHRDVKCANIFFEAAGRLPTLGDFGLVYSPGEDGPETAVSDRLGPGKWRPPELRRGGVEKRHTGSDVYLLGGVIYEALTGGEALEEVEHAGGYFAHESPELTIARFAPHDERVPHVNNLLRGMFKRDPSLRLSARNVASLCGDILAWNPDAPTPQVQLAVNEAEEAAAEYRQRSVAVRDESTRRELEVVCVHVADAIGDRNWAPLNQVTKMVDINHGDSDPLAYLRTTYPESVWMAVRVTVAFETHGARPMFMSYIFIGRPAANRQIVGVFSEDKQWSVLSDGVPGDPSHKDLMVLAATRERARLLDKLAPLIRDLR